MSFSQATITEVFPPKPWGPFQTSISWSSSSPDGTWFQLYVDGALAKSTRQTSVRLPPIGAGPSRIDIGTVDDGEENTDFSSSLPTRPDRNVALSWLGGTFLGTDIAQFKVYGSDVAGGAVDYDAALASIAAYPGGFTLDGYGLGGYGLGGYGEAAGNYTWLSNPVPSGDWSYAVVPYDASGNAGSAATVTQSIAVPPIEPGLLSDGTRCHYSYSSGTHEATLTWVATTG